MRSPIWIGVDIGGTKTAVVLSSKPPGVDVRIQFPTRPSRGPDRAVGRIKQGIEDLLSRQGFRRASIRRIGVSCGGPLDRVRGIIQAPPNLPTWENVPIRTILEQHFEVECGLENDANAGAVAEHRFGAGRGVQNMVFLTMGTGLGAGIITDGRLYHGTNDLAGEVGHVRLTRAGPVGHNKAGSAEGWASGGGLAQLASRVAGEAQRKGRSSLLSRNLQHGKALTALDVGIAAKKGDAVAIELVRSSGRRLGEVLAILVDVLNPERIVVGGLALRLGDLLFVPARQVVQREALKPAAASCEILPAELGERIGDVAALCVAMGF